MGGLQFSTVIITCLAIALPFNAFSPCCCTTNQPFSECCCSETCTSECCRINSNADVDSCCNDAETLPCSSTCNCPELINHVAVFVAELKDSDSSFQLAHIVDLLYLSPVFSNSLRSSVDRPPIGHNRRQATLCVWRKWNAHDSCFFISHLYRRIQNVHESFFGPSPRRWTCCYTICYSCI